MRMKNNPAKKRGAEAFNVYLNGKLIDTVFMTGYDTDEAKRSLVEHDGYDPGIRVVKRRGQVHKNPHKRSSKFGGVRHTTCRHCDLDIEGFAPYRSGEWRDRGNNTTCNDGKHKHAPYRSAHSRDMWPEKNPHKRSSKKPLSAAQKRARELFVQRVKSGAFKRRGKTARKPSQSTMMVHPFDTNRDANKAAYYARLNRMKKNPRTIVDPITRRRVRVKSSRVLMGGGVTRGGKPYSPGLSKKWRKNPRRRIGTAKMFVAFCVRNGKKFYLRGDNVSLAALFDSDKRNALKVRTEKLALMMVKKYARVLTKNGCSAIGSEPA